MDDIRAVLRVPRCLGHCVKRQFFFSITTYFGDKLLLLQIEGCESVVAFKASVGQFIKIAKKNNSNSDDDELEKLVRKICSEVRATPRPGNYNISYYARYKGIDSTSATLLKLVFNLVSGGAITKPSLPLVQCIQQHICGAGRNLTTPWLAVKHHCMVVQSSSRLPMSTADTTKCCASAKQWLISCWTTIQITTRTHGDRHYLQLGWQLRFVHRHPQWDEGHRGHCHGVHPASLRHHKHRKHLRDAADYPSTQETRGVLCVTHSSVYTAVALHGAIQDEPTYASNESYVRWRIADSVCGSRIQSAARCGMAVASPRER